MTREEIAQYIKSELANDDSEIYLDIDDYKVIVEALEQEPTEWQKDHAILKAYSDGANEVLENIRAEINKALSAETISDNNQQISDVGIGLELALSIIDKYKAESEDKG